MRRMLPALDDRLLIRLALGAMLVALLVRLWPVAAGMPGLAQYFMTEDGYLMQTVARNFALGLGLSVSEGTIATNGVQPLATFVYALTYWLVGADRVLGLAGVHLVSAAVAVAGALAVRALALRLLPAGPGREAAAWLAAALFFCGPRLAGNSMNGLETGLYALLVVLAMLQFLRLAEAGAAAPPRALWLMAGLLGLAFLGRNDAVFLLAALLGVWLVRALGPLGLPPGRVARSLLGPALLCLALVAPWLLHNQLVFGSIVPISGTAQSMTAGLWANAPRLPVPLFEHMFPMLPIPGALAARPLVVIVSGAVVALVLARFLWTCWRRGGAVWLTVLGYVLFGAGLAVYYGGFFGAPWFLSRYLVPLAPLLIIAALSVALELVGWLRRAWVLPAAGGIGLVLSLGLLLRAMLADQGHFQVVDWVAGNVPSETWVGAVQTGTLGYWHDRTINLDGKVNPEALRARREEGHVLHYVVASEIDYLADWIGIAGWVDREGFGAHFEVIVADPDANLAVLRRR